MEVKGRRIPMAIFITLAVFLFASSVSCTSVCLVCDGAIDVRDCPSVMTCGPHEQCFIDAYLEPQGQIRYNVGCRDSLQCVTPGRHERSANVICSACCQGDLCNARACGQKAYSADRGPICYSCQHMVTETDCGRIEQCSRDQVCTLHPIESTTTVLARFHSGCSRPDVCITFHSGCTRPDVCSNLAGTMSAIAIGKRLIQEDSICHVQCCSSDLCNSRCSNLTSITGSTAYIPSISTSTSTYTVSTHEPFPTNLDPCLTNPCMRGMCVSQGHWYSCVCDPDFTGLHCEHIVTTGSSQGACSSSPCVQGSCEPYGVTYICHCHPGYWGRNCELAHYETSTSPRPFSTTNEISAPTRPRDPCDTSPCGNGTCVSLQTSFTCICLEGFSGKYCDQDNRIECRHNWFRWKEHCYYFDITNRLNYNLAVPHCRAFHGANLVDVTSQEENDFLKHFMQTYIHKKDLWWIGIHHEKDGFWKYSFTNIVATFLDFPSVTTSSNPECAVFSRFSNYSWAYTDCMDTVAHPVCESRGYNTTIPAHLVG